MDYYEFAAVVQKRVACWNANWPENEQLLEVPDWWFRRYWNNQDTPQECATDWINYCQ